MEGTTYIERMSEVMPKVGERVYALIRESISSRRPVEDLLEDVREHALQSSRYWRVARNCYGERRLDLLRVELITVAAAISQLKWVVEEPLNSCRHSCSVLFRWEVVMIRG